MDLTAGAWRKLPPGFAAGVIRARVEEPPPARDASTVVLLRDAPAGGVEAYLLRRKATMRFAPKMHVFPGGGVDPTDAQTDVAWSGPPLAEIAHALKAEPPLARALVCAAVRETFEETGVLLAGSDADSVVDVSGPEWDDERRALEAHGTSLATVLASRGLAVRADLVLPWARWITPVIEPRRYDTRFFVAALPAGQEPRGATSEADRMVWMSPTEALARREAGDLLMLPPTAFTLGELAAHDTVASVLAAAHQREISPVMPRIVITGDEALLLLPHEDGPDAEAYRAAYREVEGRPAGHEA
ncbi:MAG: NUDIX hydrolase [Frankia sp.]